jgi:nicotinate phosphoribosyltransferase
VAIVRQRLDPEVFRLPVDKLREGYYSDQYFNLTKELLEAEGRHAPVVLQVFQKHTSVLGGIDEAIAVLRLCAGRFDTNGAWAGGWDDLVVHALHEGDEIEPCETVLTIEGDYSLFAHLETVYTTTGSCRRATGGRPTSPARSASRRTPRRRGGAGAASGPCRTG